MLFNSLEFAIFCPIVFIIYWLIHKNIKARNIFLLIVSYVFYGWWNWHFLFLIAFSSLLDYGVSLAMHKEEKEGKRKLLLGISLFFNLGFLLYFKYFNFFIESFQEAFSLFGSQISISTLNIILPVGISFYTFQTLSYTIDVYRRQLEPTKNIVAFSAFVSFFPQLVAGPIERASHLLPQFSKVHTFNYDNVKSGFFLILFGLFKKVVIADRLALLVNEVYAKPGEYDSLATIIATLFFAIQIYCDFSGYTDIAIGVARTLGFDLKKNFDTPYFSKSITEFWRRWHISLSTWFRDYLFIPLGGSRVKESRVYFNLFIVFVISGLWHGASINFIIWGAIHGGIIVIEKVIKTHKLVTIKNNSGIVTIFKTLKVFIIVCLAWVFFRAATFSDSIIILKNIFSFNYTDASLAIGLDRKDLIVAFISILLLFILELIQQKVRLYSVLQKQSVIIRWGVYVMLIFIIVVFGIYGSYDQSKFIYFQF